MFQFSVFSSDDIFDDLLRKPVGTGHHQDVRFFFVEVGRREGKGKEGMYHWMEGGHPVMWRVLWRVVYKSFGCCRFSIHEDSRSDNVHIEEWELSISFRVEYELNSLVDFIQKFQKTSESGLFVDRKHIADISKPPQLGGKCISSHLYFYHRGKTLEPMARPLSCL